MSYFPYGIESVVGAILYITYLSVRYLLCITYIRAVVFKLFTYLFSKKEILIYNS